MKRKIYAILLIFSLILASSCDREETSTIDPNTNDDLNYFIWKGLNLYYLWQKEVPDLANNRFSGFDELYTYFRNFSSPESIFESLRYQPGVVDRFSALIEDYEEFENSLQGINLSSGMEFGLVRYANNSSNLFGYVRYVLPNSPAMSAGVARGMIFNSVNNVQLTDNNFDDLLFGDDNSFVIGFADYNNANPESNGISMDIAKTSLQENPVALAKVINEGGKKIGYLLYNQFIRNFDGQLNAAFGYFKSENIDELIVDLRYNPGGSTQSATYLASMITGQFTGQLFSRQAWNEKVTQALDNDNFLNNFTNKIRNIDINGDLFLEADINNLLLNRVYFIVSQNTASASELVINGLSSYIDVHLIGTKTVGKQVGSITLYDSDNLQKSGANFNQNHRYAMQPLVFEIVNKNDQNEPLGYVPGISFSGIEMARDYGNLGVLGETSDPLLDRTLTYITTGSKSMLSTKNKIQLEEVYSSKLATPLRDNMFLDPKKEIINVLKLLNN